MWHKKRAGEKGTKRERETKRRKIVRLKISASVRRSVPWQREEGVRPRRSLRSILQSKKMCERGRERGREQESALRVKCPPRPGRRSSLFSCTQVKRNACGEERTSVPFCLLVGGVRKDAFALLQFPPHRYYVSCPLKCMCVYVCLGKIPPTNGTRERESEREKKKERK